MSRVRENSGLASVLLLAGPAVALAIQGWRQRWTSDDGFIYFRVVDNLLAGNGPVFNQGERVEAATSTLWPAVLALVHGIAGVDLPWAAALLGLALSVAGLTAGCLGSLLLWRALGRDGLAIPVGASVFAVIPATWDFATSGLETGLTFAWLGVSFLLLADSYAGRPRRRPGPAPIAVVLGLGPLIRPDLAVFSVAFVIALLALRADDPRGRRLRLVAWAAALPALYEVFRMGYYAALVPNPALAKEAGEAVWSRGWDYLVDFVDPYWLWVPLAALAALALVESRGTPGGRRAAVLALAPVLGGLISVLYVVGVGGDFMHGRLFLPGLFGMLLPVMTVPPLRWRVAAPLVAVVVAWCGLCAVDLRRSRAVHPYFQGNFVEERWFYTEFSRHPDPVSLADHAGSPWVVLGHWLGGLVGRRPHVALRPRSQRYAEADPAWSDLPARRGLDNEVVGVSFTVGQVAYAAGPEVTIVDRIGVADALASRLPTLRADRRDKPGHEKELHLAFPVALYGDLTREPGRTLAREPAVRAARRALGCGDARRLLDSTRESLSPGRFLANIANAVRLHGKRFERDPVRMAQAECPPGP